MSIEAMKQALEALEYIMLERNLDSAITIAKNARYGLRQAIAEAEREKEIHDSHCNQGDWEGVCKYGDPNCPTIAKLIAEAEKQEPVAWRWIPSEVWGTYVLSDDLEKAELAKEHGIKVEPLYTTPQQRTPLTDEQIRSMCSQSWVFDTVKQWVKIIEAAHGIKE